MADRKAISLFHHESGRWNREAELLMPTPEQYFQNRTVLSTTSAMIYRLPGREFAHHLLKTILGSVQATTRLEALSSKLDTNESRVASINGLFALIVSSSPYGDGDLSFHIQEKTQDGSSLHNIYIDASTIHVQSAKSNPGRKYAPRPRSRARSRSK
jgi:hypothetical protein